MHDKKGFSKETSAIDWLADSWCHLQTWQHGGGGADVIGGPRFGFLLKGDSDSVREGGGIEKAEAGSWPIQKYCNNIRAGKPGPYITGMYPLLKLSSSSWSFPSRKSQPLYVDLEITIDKDIAHHSPCPQPLLAPPKLYSYNWSEQYTIYTVPVYHITFLL